MVELINSAEIFVCFTSPGVQLAPALAIVNVVGRLGPEAITVNLDFNEQVARMGYGDIEAVRRLREAGVIVRNAPGVRTAILIVDDEGYIFTPTALYLEAESGHSAAQEAWISSSVTT